MKTILGAFGRGKKKNVEIKLTAEVSGKVELVLSRLRFLMNGPGATSITGAAAMPELRRIEGPAVREVADAISSSGTDMSRAITKHGGDSNVLLSAVMTTLEDSPGIFSNELSESTNADSDFEKWKIEISCEVDKLSVHSSQLLAHLLATADGLAEHAPAALLESMVGSLFALRGPVSDVVKDARVKLVVNLIGKNAVLDQHMNVLHMEEKAGLPREKEQFWIEKFGHLESGLLGNSKSSAPPRSGPARITLGSIGSSIDDPFDTGESPMVEEGGLPAAPRGGFSVDVLAVDTAAPPDDSPQGRHARRPPSGDPSAASRGSSPRGLNPTGSYISPPASPSVSEMSDRASPRHTHRRRFSNMSSSNNSPESRGSAGGRERGHFFDKVDDSDVLDSIPTLDESADEVGAFSPPGAAAARSARGATSLSEDSSPQSRVGGRRRFGSTEPPPKVKEGGGGTALDGLDREEITADDLRRAFDSCPVGDGETVSARVLERKLRWSQGVPALADAIMHMREAGRVSDNISWEQLRQLSAPYIKVMSPDPSPSKRKSALSSRQGSRDSHLSIGSTDASAAGALNESLESLDMERLSWSPAKKGYPNTDPLAAMLAMQGGAPQSSPVNMKKRFFDGTESKSSIAEEPDQDSHSGMSGMDMVAFTNFSPKPVVRTMGNVEFSDEEMMTSPLSNARSVTSNSSRRGRGLGIIGSEKQGAANREGFKEGVSYIPNLSTQSTHVPSPTSDMEMSIGAYVDAQTKPSPTDSSGSRVSPGRRGGPTAEEKRASPVSRRHWALTGDDLDSSLESERSVPLGRRTAPSRDIYDVASETKELKLDPRAPSAASVELDVPWDDDEEEDDNIPSLDSEETDSKRADGGQAESKTQNAAPRYAAPKASQRSMFSLTALDTSMSDADSDPASPDRQTSVYETKGSDDRSSGSDNFSRETEPVRRNPAVADSLQSGGANKSISPLVRNSMKREFPLDAAPKGFGDALTTDSRDSNEADMKSTVSENTPAMEPKLSRATHIASPSDHREHADVRSDMSGPDMGTEEAHNSERDSDADSVSGMSGSSKPTKAKRAFKTFFKFTKSTGSKALNEDPETKVIKAASVDPIAEATEKENKSAAPSVKGFFSVSSKLRNTASNVGADVPTEKPLEAREGHPDSAPPAAKEDPFAETEDLKTAPSPTNFFSVSSKLRESARSLPAEDNTEASKDTIDSEAQGAEKPKDPFEEQSVAKSMSSSGRFFSLSSKFRGSSSDANKDDIIKTESRDTVISDTKSEKQQPVKKDPFAEKSSKNLAPTTGRFFSLSSKFRDTGSNLTESDSANAGQAKNPTNETKDFWGSTDDPGTRESVPAEGDSKQSPEKDKELKRKGSWLRSVGSKATSFLGRRSGSFGNTDTDPAGPHPPHGETVLVPQQSRPGGDDATADTESAHSTSTVSKPPPESREEEPEANKSMTDIDIMNEIRKDVNNAKKKIATEAKFSEDGKVVFESQAVKEPATGASLEVAGRRQLEEDVLQSWGATDRDTPRQFGHDDTRRRDPDAERRNSKRLGNYVDETDSPETGSVDEEYHPVDAEEPDVAVPQPPTHPPPRGPSEEVASESSHPDSQPYAIDVSAVEASQYPEMTRWENDNKGDDITEVDRNSPSKEAVRIPEQEDVYADRDAVAHRRKGDSAIAALAEGPESTRQAAQLVRPSKVVRVVNSPSIHEPTEPHFSLEVSPTRSHDTVHRQELTRDAPQRRHEDPTRGSTRRDRADVHDVEDSVQPVGLQEPSLSYATRRTPSRSTARPQPVGSVFKHDLPGPKHAGSPENTPGRISSHFTHRPTHTPPKSAMHSRTTLSRGVGSIGESPVCNRPDLSHTLGPDVFTRTNASDLGFADTMEMPKMVPFCEDTNNFSFLSSRGHDYGSPKGKSPGVQPCLEPSCMMSPWLQTMRGRERENVSPSKNSLRASAPQRVEPLGPGYPRYATVSLSDYDTTGLRRSPKKSNTSWVNTDGLSLGQLLSAYVDEARAASPTRRPRANSHELHRSDERVDGDTSAGRWQMSCRILHGRNSPDPKFSHSVDLSMRGSPSKRSIYNRNEADGITEMQRRLEEKVEAALRKSNESARPRYRDINAGIGPQSSMEKVLMRSMSSKNVASRNNSSVKGAPDKADTLEFARSRKEADTGTTGPYKHAWEDNRKPSRIENKRAAEEGDKLNNEASPTEIRPRYRDVNVGIGPKSSMEKVLMRSMAATKASRKLHDVGQRHES